MTYKERLKNRTGIDSLQKLLEQEPKYIYRTPNLGARTMKGAILELTKESFGEWYELLFTAIFEEIITKNTNGYWFYIERKK